MNKSVIKSIQALIEEDHMTKEKWETLFEALKEPARLLLLAFISWLATELSGVNETWAVGLLFALRFLDKWLHEYGKRENKALLSKGITRF